MECSSSSLLWLSLLVTAALLLLRSRLRNRTHLRPPGPSGWPVLGNIFDLGTVPHQNLYKLRFEYGPVLWLKLGSVNTMAVQSAAAAAELFKNHDASFCDRPDLHVFTAENLQLGSLAVGRYGAYWRMPRRICSSELLVTKRVTDTAPLRQKCVDDMIRYIEEESAAAVARGESGEVNLHVFLFLMAFNVVGNLTVSRDLLGPHSKQGPEFYDALKKVVEWAGTPNMADFFPWVRWLDPQGLKKNMDRDLGTAMRIIADFVKDRIEDRKLGKEKLNKDFLDAVLEHEGEGRDDSQKMSDHNKIIIVLEMFFAGSETTSITLEWAMTELLRHPETMRKAQEELDRVVGRQRKVEEGDIDQLPYLQAVVKEVLRLHPPLPLLVPRNTLEDTRFMGYMIPKNTRVFVNAWAIGRDPDSWEDPLSFKPERFLGSNIEYKDKNYELIPFGSGRRICVGMALGHKVIHLALTTLIHRFDWKLDSTVTPETIDMKETPGITSRKFVPLKAMPQKRI